MASLNELDLSAMKKVIESRVLRAGNRKAAFGWFLSCNGDI